ncbi:sigma factor-like helix-turn-helix DNA-binding protein [Streptomyces sp. NPDC046237]|uniref:sigma factor-like helix-turn-helix DNA-binding protein n=1 Tax=Streptomyces sp. NPDC046237 TaxID=3154914 RepID=UPI00340576F2
MPSPKERRRLREARGLSEDQVAEAMGVTRATVRSWETGRTTPRGRKQEAYAKLIGAYDEQRTPSDPSPEPKPAGAPEPTAPVQPPKPAVGAGAATANTRPRAATKRAAKPPKAPAAAALGIGGGIAAFGGIGGGHKAPRAVRAGAPGAQQPLEKLKPVETPPRPLHAPAEQAPAEQFPAGQVPAGQVPAEPTAAEQFPAEPFPAEQAPAEQVPVEQAPAGQAPAEPTAAEQFPVGQVPAEPFPAEQAPAEPFPARQAPAEQVPAEQAPAGQVPAEQAPAEPFPAEQAPAEPTAAEQFPVGQVPAEQFPAEPFPAGQAPAEPFPVEQAPAGQAPAEQFPAEPTARPEQFRAEQPPETALAGPSLTPEEAFDALYAHAAPGLLHQTYLLTGRRRLSRESVEHAFHHAWQHWPEVAVDRDPVGWVRAAAYEYALSPWHRLRRTHKHPDAPPTEAGLRELLAALLELPPPYRRTVLLYDGLGLDLPETAAETEASTPAAANRVLHARTVIGQRVPELADPDALHRTLGALATEAPTATLPEARSVRTGSERSSRMWTRAVIGVTAALIAVTAITAATAPTQYLPLIHPGERVNGVPVRGGSPQLTPEDVKLRDTLRSQPHNGPERLIPDPH